MGCEIIMSSVVNPISALVNIGNQSSSNEEAVTPEKEPRSCCGYFKLSVKLIPVITVLILSIVALVTAIVLGNTPVAVISGLIFIFAAIIAYQLATSETGAMIRRLKESQLMANNLNRALRDNLQDIESHTGDLKLAVRTMQTENDKLSAEVSSLEKSNNQLTQNLQTVKAMLEESRTLILSLEENREALKTEILHLKTENEQLTGSLATLHTVTLKLTEAGAIIGRDALTVQASLDQLTTCLKEIQAIEITSQDLRETSGELKIDVSEFKTQAAVLINHLMSIFSDDFKRSMAQNAEQCRLNIRDLTEARSALEQARRELSDSVSEERERLSHIKEDIAQAQSTRVTLQTQIQCLEEIVHRSQLQCTQLQREIDRLSREVDRMTESSSRAQENSEIDDNNS